MTDIPKELHAFEAKEDLMVKVMNATQLADYLYDLAFNHNWDDRIKGLADATNYLDSHSALGGPESADLRAHANVLRALGSYLIQITQPVTIHRRLYSASDIAGLKDVVDNLIVMHKPFRPQHHCIRLGYNLYDLLMGVDGFIEGMNLVTNHHLIYYHGFMGWYKQIGVFSDAYLPLKFRTLLDFEAHITYLINPLDIKCREFNSIKPTSIKRI